MPFITNLPFLVPLLALAPSSWLDYEESMNSARSSLFGSPRLDFGDDSYMSPRTPSSYRSPRIPSPGRSRRTVEVRLLVCLPEEDHGHSYSREATSVGQLYSDFRRTYNLVRPFRIMFWDDTFRTFVYLDNISQIRDKAYRIQVEYTDEVAGVEPETTAAATQDNNGRAPVDAGATVPPEDPFADPDAADQQSPRVTILGLPTLDTDDQMAAHLLPNQGHGTALPSSFLDDTSNPFFANHAYELSRIPIDDMSQHGQQDLIGSGAKVDWTSVSYETDEEVVTETTLSVGQASSADSGSPLIRPPFGGSTGDSEMAAIGVPLSPAFFNTIAAATAAASGGDHSVYASLPDGLDFATAAKGAHGGFDVGNGSIDIGHGLRILDPSAVDVISMDATDTVTYVDGVLAPFGINGGGGPQGGPVTVFGGGDLLGNAGAVPVVTGGTIKGHQLQEPPVAAGTKGTSAKAEKKGKKKQKKKGKSKASGTTSAKSSTAKAKTGTDLSRPSISLLTLKVLSILRDNDWNVPLKVCFIFALWKGWPGVGGGRQGLW